MEKFHRVFTNRDSEYIGFLCRVINFLEDIYEDAECGDIKVSLSNLNSSIVSLTPFNCLYDIDESISIFSEQHGIDRAEIADETLDSISLSKLYDIVIDKYREALHYYILKYLDKTITTGYEYYLGVLFNGKCFLLEGERNRITIPRIPQCISAHTHPSNYPAPSSRDIDEIVNIFIDRGVGHVIIAKSTGMAIYRVKPLTESDLETIKELGNVNSVELIRTLSRMKTIKVMFF